jgi:IclR family mhp operon transcriptional activator
MHFNRSLGRGLKMLAILNAGGEHRVASLARAVKLPRSTAFRILCTLLEEGYVWRDPATDLYHPTSMVLSLSDGFDGMARLVEKAKPVVTELGRQLVWPVMLATLSGKSVLLRQTTDATSPLAVVRYTPGFRAPPLDRASGLVLLACSGAQQRQMALDLLYREDEEKQELPKRADIEARLADIRKLGYACIHRPGTPSNRSSLAVPIRAGGDLLATLVVRFAKTAVTQHVVMQRFLPALRQAAHEIVTRFECAATPKSQSAVLNPARGKRETEVPHA